jgi:hypothetical protein
MFPPAQVFVYSYGFLTGLLMDSENDDNVFLQNVGLSPNYTLLQPGITNFSYFLIDYTRKNESGKAVNVMG